MRNTIINTISTVFGTNRGQVAVVVKSVLRSSLKQTRSFYCPMLACPAPVAAAFERAADWADSARLRHHGHDSMLSGSGCGWQPMGLCSGPVC